MNVGESHHYVLDARQLRDGLATSRIARSILVLSEVPSTNSAAFDLAASGAEDGTVIFTDHQPQGRGRLGRTWVSPRSASILCSVLLIDQPNEKAQSLDTCAMNLATGIAVVDAVATTVPDIEPVIRWPNDVMVAARKLSGILIETRPLAVQSPERAQGGSNASADSDRRAVVVGIGINCLQHRAHFTTAGLHHATSLDAESKESIDRTEVARRLLQELDAWLARPVSHDVLRREWLDRAEPLGQHIRLRLAGEQFSGRTIDIDPTAGLVVELDAGGRRVFDPNLTSLLPTH